MDKRVELTRLVVLLTEAERIYNELLTHSESSTERTDWGIDHVYTISAKRFAEAELDSMRIKDLNKCV